MTVFFFILGLIILTAGAEFLVRGSSKLAGRLGIPPLIIGLTIVAYGTSSPEMAVSVKAALVGQADIALGNVVGSNIFNILFILGVSALIVPLTISRQILRIELAIMIGTAILCMLLALDGNISRIDGVIFFVGIVIYTLFQVILARRDRNQEEITSVEGIDLKKLTPNAKGYAIDLAMIAVGLVVLVYGARMMVDAAVEIALALGISELVIGLTIIAAGTSMPEVATSIMASIKGERDIAVGNVVGSNIFNILAVLGVSAAVSPEGVNVAVSALKFDIPAMILVSALCFPIFFTGKQINRAEGAFFLALYVVYTILLILLAKGTLSIPW
ncbi:MAG: calcium/sodium antiporter [Candidatus Sumerlaeia bacterium]|nr:calcium/sodium antiporter [Candidatus Sumerlaeia bacterium]